MVLATTERCGGGNLQKLNYGSLGEPVWSWPQQKGAAAGIFKNLTMDPSESPCRLHAPQQLTMEILGTGAPRPPKTMLKKNNFATPRKFFGPPRKTSFVASTLFLGGGGKGVSIVKLLRRVCTTFVGNASCASRQHVRLVPEDTQQWLRKPSTT